MKPHQSKTRGTIGNRTENFKGAPASPLQEMVNTSPRIIRGASTKKAASNFAIHQTPVASEQVLQRAYNGDKDPGSAKSLALWQRVKAEIFPDGINADHGKDIFDSLIRSNDDYTGLAAINDAIMTRLFSSSSSGSDGEEQWEAARQIPKECWGDDSKITDWINCNDRSTFRRFKNGSLVQQIASQIPQRFDHET